MPHLQIDRDFVRWRSQNWLELAARSWAYYLVYGRGVVMLSSPRGERPDLIRDAMIFLPESAAPAEMRGDIKKFDPKKEVFCLFLPKNSDGQVESNGGLAITLDAPTLAREENKSIPQVFETLSHEKLPAQIEEDKRPTCLLALANLSQMYFAKFRRTPSMEEISRWIFRLNNTERKVLVSLVNNFGALEDYMNTHAAAPSQSHFEALPQSRPLVAAILLRLMFEHKRSNGIDSAPPEATTNLWIAKLNSCSDERLRDLQKDWSSLQAHLANREPQRAQASQSENDEWISFVCGRCGHPLRIPKEYAGKKGRCAKCKEIVFAPSLLRENLS